MQASKEKNKVLPNEEVALFCNQVAMILKAGIPLHDGIETLCETYRVTRYCEVFQQMQEEMVQTGSLYETVNNAGIFPSYMVQMVRIAEQAGDLEAVMNTLSDYYEREARLKNAVHNAVVYPLVLIAVMAVLITVLSVKIIPIFNEVFANMGTQMSAGAQSVMNFGIVAGRVVLILVAVLIVCAVSVYVLLKTKMHDRVEERLLNMFPPVRRINEMVSAARFSSVMGKLIQSGFPLEEAVALVPDILPDRQIAEKVALCKERISNGASFVDAVENTRMYSDIHMKMIRVAAAAGQMDTVMDKLAELYDEQANRAIDRLVGMIEPVMVAFMSVIIGAIMLSVMLPLASIMSSMV